MENNDKELSKLDIGKQLWLARQKELSECEIIERRKKRNLYWMWQKIFILLAVIMIFILIYWGEIVEWVRTIRD